METPTIDTPAVRHDGWTPERKTRFLDCLAARGNVRIACRRAGMSPEAAYRLRRREPLFARGWAAALLKAREVTEDVIADRAVDGIEEKIYHRGELIDTRRRYDARLLLAHMARLDKLADDETASADAARFDELLACIAGETVPGDLQGMDDVLPVERETAGERAARRAEHEVRYAEAEEAEEAEGDEEDEEDEEDEAEYDPNVFDAFEDKCEAAAERGRAEGQARWDVWFDNACFFVDRTIGWSEEPPAPGLPGNPLPAPLRERLENAAKEQAELAVFAPRTLSTTSTSALALSLAKTSPVRSYPRGGSPKKFRSSTPIQPKM